MIDPSAVATGAIAGVATDKLSEPIEGLFHKPGEFDTHHPLWLMAADFMARFIQLEKRINAYLDAQESGVPGGNIMLPVALSNMVFKLNRLGRKHAAIMPATNVTVTISVSGLGANELNVSMTGGQWNALDVPDTSELSIAAGTQVGCLLWLGEDEPSGLV